MVAILKHHSIDIGFSDIPNKIHGLSMKSHKHSQLKHRLWLDWQGWGVITRDKSKRQVIHQEGKGKKQVVNQEGKGRSQYQEGIRESKSIGTRQMKKRRSMRSLTVRSITVRSLTVRSLTVRSLTVRSLTVRSLTVRSLTVK